MHLVLQLNFASGELKECKPSSPLFELNERKKKMNCPKCNEKAYIVTQTKGVTTLLGAGAGGYVAATAGAKTGAVVGSFICPGIGTAVGGLLGILTGAAAGAVAGNTVGRLIDENIMRLYRCPSCDHQWRL